MSGVEVRRVLCACIVTGAATLSAAEPLNVLFIAADDLGNVLGPDKPEILKTPNFDRLINQGVYFHEAYCQIPLCNPSRASVMTGRRPDATGVWDLDRHFRDRLPDVVTLSQHFRNAGYWGGRVGKIYHYDVPRGIGTSGLDDEPSWDEVFNPKGRDVTDEALITNPTPEKKVSAAMCWLAAEGTDEEQTDGLITTETIRQLELHKNEPFFLACGWFRPHTPYVAPKKYFDMYPLDKIELHADALAGVAGEDVWANIPPAAIPHNVPEPNYGLTVDELKKSVQAYYACVSFIDAQLGRLLDAVEANGLQDNTLIVFWSDHGYHLGEHALWQKRTLFDQSARAPLIISHPSNEFSRRAVSEKIVEFVDIAPTVCDLAGVGPFANADGRSLRPLMQEPDLKSWQGRAYAQILRPARDGIHDGQMVMGSMVVTESFRCIEWDVGRAGLELYDRGADPAERTNLAEHPDYQQWLPHLRKQLSNIQRTTPTRDPVNQSRL